MLDDPNDEPESRLIPLYESPVPADFEKDLQQRLHEEMRRKIHFRPWRMIGAVAAAAAIALAILLAQPWKHAAQPDKKPTVARTPSSFSTLSVIHPDSEIEEVRLKTAIENSLPPPDVAQTLADPKTPDDVNNLSTLSTIRVVAGNPFHAGDDKYAGYKVHTIDSLRRIDLVETMSHAALIVKAKVIRWEDPYVVYDVERTIYGAAPATQTIRIQTFFSDPNGRGQLMEQMRKNLEEQGKPVPLGDEFLTAFFKQEGVEKDKNVILLLGSEHDGVFTQLRALYDVPPDHSLDKAQRDIMDIVRSGRYLDVQMNAREDTYYETRPYDVAVRAKLEKTDNQSAYWRVEKTLKGKELTKTTLVIGHDLFRLRAQAIVNELSISDEEEDLHVKEYFEARVAKEMKKLIDAELPPGREAILFLNKIEPDGDVCRAQLLYRLYDNSDRMTLDELEKEIASPTKKENNNL